jgi:hypothetical protein
MASILASNALTTYAAAKARINSVGAQLVDADHQAEVERIINALSQAVEHYCDRPLCLASRVELHSPPRGERLILDCAPVASVTSVLLDGTAVEDSEIEDAARGYLSRSGGWSGQAFESAAPGAVSVTLATVPRSAPRVLSVTYSAGYVSPTQAAADPTGGASLATRTGTGACVVAGTAGVGASGTLALTLTKTSETWGLSAAWKGGTPLVLAGITPLELEAGIDLASLDSALLGLTLTCASVPSDVSPCSESWAVVPSVQPPTRTLPWDIEEAVLVAVAMLWRMRLGGYAADVLPERNEAIGRGSAGMLPDVVLPWLAPYRRVW